MVVKVFIVEDEYIHLTDLSIMIEQAGYEVVGSCDNADEAFELIKKTQPDVVLADIALPGFNNGISLSTRINKELGIPHIFITSMAEDEILEHAVTSNPAGYLKKPINPVSLVATIKIALSNNVENIEEESLTSKSDLLFTRIGDRLVKIPLGEIRYIQADSSKYISVVLNKKEIACRISLKDFLKQLPASFLQIHRSVVINMDYLIEINEKDQSAIIGNKELPIGRKYRKDLNAVLKRI